MVKLLIVMAVAVSGNKITILSKFINATPLSCQQNLILKILSQTIWCNKTLLKCIVTFFDLNK